ncbi:MAG TPA: alpha/beta fold hydrolase [Kineosporiaceae bacterium]|nr:alpha/beta fold hydrolase [Kineosporiaceae bacterium]
MTTDRQDVVQLTGGPSLAVRAATAPLRPFLLVHDIGADSRVWAGVAERLYAAGHQVTAVDLRGHGSSDSPATGYDTDTCADDLSALLDALGFTGGRSPVVVGHGWGANVVMSLAARRDGVAGVCCLDGGWIRPAWQYGSFEEYWLACGPNQAQTSEAQTGEAQTGETRSQDRTNAIRRSIVRSLFFGEPRAWFPLVGVPVVLCPVVPPDGVPDPEGRGRVARTGVAEALSRLPRARVSWHYGEGDAIGTNPSRLVEDLLTLAADAEPRVD